MSERHMPNPERNGQIETELKLKEMTGYEKFSKVLNLFGTPDARTKFLDWCKQYNGLRNAQVAVNYGAMAGISEIGENHFVPKKESSPPKRAEIHNRIMDALQRLSIQHKSMDKLDRAILNEMADRSITAKYIREYFAKQGDYENSDVEEDATSREIRSSSSDVGYWHSKGRET